MVRIKNVPVNEGGEGIGVSLGEKKYREDQGEVARR